MGPVDTSGAVAAGTTSAASGAAAAGPYGNPSRREVTRLTKAGSYRFGALRLPWPVIKPLPRPRYPGFSSRHPRFYVQYSGFSLRQPNSTSRHLDGSQRGWLISCAVAAAMIGAGAWVGLWWLPFVAGVAGGLAAPTRRARWVLSWGVLAVAAGWGTVLWLPALTGEPEGATARAIAALAGLPPYASVGVAATLLIGMLQAVVAVWLARAAGRIARGRGIRS
jgi:hypothetical protein